MAVTLPTFADVGIVDPRSVGSQPAYPQNDAVAEGEATLGKGIEKAGGAIEDVAAYGQMARNRMDRAMADADFTGRIIPLTEQLKKETDPEKITALRGQFQTALETSGQAIADPAARQLWAAQQSKHVAAGQAEADLRNTAVYRDRYKAGIRDQLDNLVRTGTTASDPTAFALTRDNIGHLTQSGEGSGSLTAEEGYALRKVYTKQLIEGRALNLANGGNPEAAKSFLDEHVADLDPITAETLRGRIERLGDKKATLDLTNGIWGGADSGRAGNLGTDVGNPGSLAMAAAAVDPAIETAVAKKIATTSGLQHWAGVDPDTGKPWNPALRAAFQAAGLPTDGPISEEQWNKADPLILKHESMGGQNVPNYRFDATHTAGGPHQITNSTWKAFGGPELMAAGSSGTEPTATTDAPPAQPAALAPLPDIEAMTQRVQDMAASGQITQERANAVEGALRSRYNHVQAAQANLRAALGRQLQNGMAMLADGGDFDYDPATVRHFFPKEKADDILQQLQDAKDGGQIVAGVRNASPDQIEQQRAALEAGLNDPKATDYAKRRVILNAFQKAVKDQQDMLTGPKADPVAYLAQYSPLVQAKRAAIDPKNPQTFQDYATTVLSEQERMGVPPEQRHILTVNAASQIAAAIGTDPEHAPDTMRAIATQYGQAWPNVWGDLITAGKLPAGYQVVGQLADYDQTNASVLARSLGASAKDDKTFKALVSSKAPGGKSIEDVTKQTIPTDSRIVAYERSLVDSGASPGQVVAIRSAVEHLAAGRAIFMHEDPSEATEKAIDAVVGHYEFMPNGGARVPNDKFEAVSANAQAIRNGLSLDNVAVPPLYGSSPALPKPQEYVDMVRAAPSWITGPKADRLLLLDAGGRLVTGKDGVPIAVPFDMPNVAPPRQPSPYAGPF